MHIYAAQAASLMLKDQVNNCCIWAWATSSTL